MERRRAVAALRDDGATLAMDGSLSPLFRLSQIISFRSLQRLLCLFRQLLDPLRIHAFYGSVVATRGRTASFAFVLQLRIGGLLFGICLLIRVALEFGLLVHEIASAYLVRARRVPQEAPTHQPGCQRSGADRNQTCVRPANDAIEEVARVGPF
jgi:hypothetical protein